MVSIECRMLFMWYQTWSSGNQHREKVAKRPIITYVDQLQVDTGYATGRLRTVWRIVDYWELASLSSFILCQGECLSTFYLYNYRLITAYLLLRVNLDKIMHARWDFDASSARTRRVSALDKHQNWSASALFCLNSRAQSKYAVVNLIHTRRKQTFFIFYYVINKTF